MINTGTTPALPDLPGLAEADVWTSETILELERLPETTGTWKAVIDADTDLILGAALLGHDAGEVIAALQMAMLGGLRYQQVRDAVITHPTMAEGLNLLFDSLDG